MYVITAKTLPIINKLRSNSSKISRPNITMFKDRFEIANLQAAQSSTASNDGEHSSSQQDKQEEEGYNSDILLANAKLERNCADDSIPSSEWVKDFRAKSLVMGTMHPSVFVADNASSTWASSLDYSACPHEECKLPHANTAVSVLPTKTAAVKKSNTSPSSSNVKKQRKKKRYLRVLDESRVVEKTDHDILFGRGRFTNKHPGNIYYHQKALELLPSYILSSKEDKQDITNLLIESIKGEGRRFLEKGKDNMWHEVIDGVFHKASQTFRDI